MKRTALKIARIQNDMTQKDLALKIKVSQQTIAKWETGRACPSGFAQMRKLETTLGTPMQVLFPDIFSCETVNPVAKTEGII